MVERSHRAAARGAGATKPLISLAIGVDTHRSAAPSRQQTARHFRSSYSCYGPLVSGQPESLADGNALSPRANRSSTGSSFSLWATASVSLVPAALTAFRYCSVAE